MGLFCLVQVSRRQFLNSSVCLTIPQASFHLLYFYFSFIEHPLSRLHKFQSSLNLPNVTIADKSFCF